MRSKSFNNGCNLRKSLLAAERLGCTIEHRSGTGELFVRHPTLQKPLRVCGHRKDAPRVLTTFLQHLDADH